jgi:hypothetical protein
MKKLPLLLALTGFSVAASAQQGDFFDIQKHLQKKRKETKLVYKPLLLKPSLQNQFDISQSGNNNNPGTLSHVLPNGDKVYKLFQDNMPCIVPDISKPNYFGISNLAKYPNTIILPDNMPGNIPNVAAPKKIIISR